MDDDRRTAVLVVGAGAAGLSTAGALMRRGIRAAVIDKDDSIGGTWARRYERLRLHTIRQFSGLAHYPIPGDRPRYLSKDEYAAYLREYAEAFALDVSLGERVTAVRRDTRREGRLGWEIVTSRGTRRVAVVVIATGHHAEAVLPTWDGVEAFGGTIMHSSAYTTGASYRGLRALVIGLGNSGAEVAADLAEHHAASVSVVPRTVPPIVSRELFGIVPVQLIGIALTPLGVPRLIDWCGAALRRIATGELGAFGLGRAAWGPFTARRPAVIDTGFLAALKRGRIVVRAGIRRFDQTGVLYVDGAREEIDVVISATGFRSGLEHIIQVPDVLGPDGQPAARSGRATAASGLYFVGFEETVRGHLYEANRESRRLAAEIERYLSKLSAPLP